VRQVIDAALIDELANVAAAIRGEARPFVAAVDAVRAVERCEAADLSIATGGTVALPMSPASGGHVP
jgi:predicted dehydrogenase